MGKWSLGDFIDGGMDTDQAGEESELKVKKCEGRRNSMSWISKNKEIKVIFDR